MLAAVRSVNRLERAGETLRAVVPSHWYERYGRRVENYRLPKTEAARFALAAEVGAEGQHLLHVLDAATGQPELAQLPKVRVLRQVWAAQYVADGERLRLGSAAELLPSAEQVSTPYDPDARNSNTAWVGYKVQLTETCDLPCEGPHVITNVETTLATKPDDNIGRCDPQQP